ncbi:hypothetical protein SRHO_G00303420 [Serrasalmus rhombeus]
MITESRTGRRSADDGAALGQRQKYTHSSAVILSYSSTMRPHTHGRTEEARKPLIRRHDAGVGPHHRLAPANIHNTSSSTSAVTLPDLLPQPRRGVTAGEA